MSLGSQVPPKATWPFDPSHFLPKHQQRNHYERREEWMSDLILNERLQGRCWASLLTHLFTLERSHTGNPASHSICEGTRYNLVVNTREHRCWGFIRLEETPKNNLFHPTALERIQLYLYCSWLIFKQLLMMLKSWKSQFNRLFHCFSFINAEATMYHLVKHKHRGHCFTTPLWHLKVITSCSPCHSSFIGAETTPDLSTFLHRSYFLNL